MRYSCLLDPGNRLLMDLEGRKPANPFPDERSFEDSLQLNFHPGMNRLIICKLSKSVSVINI